MSAALGCGRTAHGQQVHGGEGCTSSLKQEDLCPSLTGMAGLGGTSQGPGCRLWGMLPLEREGVRVTSCGTFPVGPPVSPRPSRAG